MIVNYVLADLPPADQREEYLRDPQNLALPPDLPVPRRSTYSLSTNLKKKLMVSISGKRQKKRTRTAEGIQKQQESQLAKWQPKGSHWRMY